MIKLFHLAQLPLQEFKEHFEKIVSIDKYTKKETDLNILGFAFLNANSEVIEYLLKNYDYNLKKELNIKLYGIDFKNYISLAYMIRPISSGKIEVHDFENTLKILKDNNIIIQDLISSEVESLEIKRPCEFFDYPYFPLLVKYDYFDSAILSKNLMYIFDSYIHENNIFRENELLNLIVNSDHFNPVNIDFGTLISFYNIDYNFFNINESVSDKFLEKMRNTYINETGLTNNMLSESIINLYIRNGDYFKNLMINIKKFNDTNGKSSCDLELLLKRMLPETPIMLNESLIKMCIDSASINTYRSLRKMRPDLKQDQYLMNKYKNDLLPEEQKEDFVIIEREIITKKTNIEDKNIIPKKRI